MRNGTQEDLDEVLGGAADLPFGVVFRSLYGDTAGTEVYRLASSFDDNRSVLFTNIQGQTDFHYTDQLGLIKGQHLDQREALDAKRYRWLRSVGPEQQNVLAHYTDVGMDKKIDELMAKEKV